MAELTVFVTNAAGAPLTGLTNPNIPTVLAVRSPANTVAVGPVDTTELTLAPGWYQYTFATVDGVEYVVTIDTDPSNIGQVPATQRYRAFVISGEQTARIEVDIPAILVDTGIVEPLVSANLNATVSSRATQADILSDATPFAGANVDVAISTRSSHSAADVDTVLTAAHSAGSWNGTTPAAIWGELLPGAFGAGTAGFILGTNLDVLVSSRSSHSAADVDVVLSAAHGAGSWLSASVSPAAIATAVWSEALPGGFGAGEAGEIVGTNIDAAVSSRSSHSAADVDTTLSAAHGAGSWEGSTASAVADAVWSRSVDDAEFSFPAAGRVLNRVFRYGTLPRRLNLTLQKLEIGDDAAFSTIVQSWDVETITGGAQPVVDQFGSPSVRLDPDLAF